MVDASTSISWESVHKILCKWGRHGDFLCPFIWSLVSGPMRFHVDPTKEQHILSFFMLSVDLILYT
jgi:hypothetical protein